MACAKTSLTLGISSSAHFSVLEWWYSEVLVTVVTVGFFLWAFPVYLAVGILSDGLVGVTLTTF